jgi:hypothetical protein
MNCHARGCPPLRPDTAACHCPACHQTFSGLGLFDDHQDWSQGWASGVSCKAPAASGLVWGGSAWWTPEGLQASTERVGRMHQARAA